METKKTKDGINIYCSFTRVVDISDLKPNPKNPNTHPEDQLEILQEIIKKNGWRLPITVSNQSGYIVRGEGRYLASVKAGFTEIPVDYQDYDSEESELADLVSAHQIYELSIIDQESLSEILQELKMSDLDLVATGYNVQDLDNILNELDINSSFNDDFDVDEEYENITEPISERGTVYILDNKHRVMCGDSTSSSDVETLMNGENCQLIVTDPPYNVNYQGTAGSIENDNMSNKDFEIFLSAVYKNMNDSIIKGGAIYVFHADTSGNIFRNSFIEAGFLLKQCLIWKKNQFVLGRQDYHWIHEPILYGWKDGDSHYFTDERFHSTVLEEVETLKNYSKEELIEYIGKLKNDISDMTTVINHDKPTRNADHPTMKPVELLAKLIFNSSKLGWLVQDLFGGSGSTLIASDQLKRRCNLMEYDPKYCDVILKRYKAYKESQGEIPVIEKINKSGEKEIIEI